MVIHPPRESHDIVPSGWPTPDAEDIARHHTLVRRIRDEIDAASGAIPFTRFMELALYAPALGYYSAPKPQFGEDGDFITAPELSPLFGRCVANQIAQVLQAIDGGDVLEAGAGTGALAADVLRALENVGALPTHYFILEVSAALRALQQDTIHRRAPHLLSRVHWLDALPEPGFRGVIVGNELLDAMPVTRFCVNDETVVEQHVTYEGKVDGTRFAWTTRPAGAALVARANALDLPSGYCSEMASHADAWVRSLAVRLAHGAILLLDYGFPQAEFYHPQRAQGTLMCHYRHRTHADPLILAGLQDITAHVDFTAIAEAAHGAGLEVLGYTSQAAFLIGCGLTELAIERLETRAHLERAQAINKLTAPHEMGELFKVIAFGRGVHGPLRGFVVQDRRSRL